MLGSEYLSAMKQFEGFSSRAGWDYAQNSNGYGTRALYAGEVIDKAEAERRFSAAVSQASDAVDRFAPDLDEGTRAALTSLTYNAGTAWMQSGLGEAVQAGDMDRARSLFVTYNKAGGTTLDGLVQRRLNEVAWFGKGSDAVASTAAAPSPAYDAASAAMAAASADLQAATSAPAAPENTAGMHLEHRSATSDNSATDADGVADRAGRRGPNVASDGILLSLLALISKSGADVRGGADAGADRKAVAEIEVPLGSA